MILSCIFLYALISKQECRLYFLCLCLRNVNTFSSEFDSSKSAQHMMLLLESTCRSCMTVATAADRRCGRSDLKLAEEQMDQLVPSGGLPW